MHCRGAFAPRIEHAASQIQDSRDLSDLLLIKCRLCRSHIVFSLSINAGRQPLNHWTSLGKRVKEFIVERTSQDYGSRESSFLMKGIHNLHSCSRPKVAARDPPQGFGNALSLGMAGGAAAVLVFFSSRPYKKRSRSCFRS
jgi:hypothetical protein